MRRRCEAGSSLRSEGVGYPEQDGGDDLAVASVKSQLAPSIMRGRHWIIGAFACLIPLAACADPSGQSATQAIEPHIATSTVIATEARNEPEPQGPADSSTAMVLQVLATCRGFDPAIDDSIDSTSAYGFALVNEVFSGLTALTGDSSRPIRNELLDGFSVSANGLVYEFTLRPDLKFSDGAALTASDVKWSWERAWRMSVSGGRARDVFGNVAGAEPRRAELPGVRVVDDRNLVVTLSQPVPGFPMFLADPVAAVLKQDNVAQWRSVVTNGPRPTMLTRTHITRPEPPIGAGPFAYSDFDWFNFDECPLVRNPHHHGPPARVDAVQAIDDRHILEYSGISVTPDELTFEAEVAAQKKAFNQRKIDIMVLPMDADEDGDNTDSDMPAVTRILVERPMTQIVALNTAQVPFDDVNYRRAIAASWDIAGLFGEDQPRRIIPPAVADPELGASGYQFNLSLASTFLEESRYPLGSELEPVTLFSPYLGPFVDWLGTVFGAWRDSVGLTVRVVSPRHPDWREPNARGDGDLVFLTINAARPDPYGVLSAVIASGAGDQPSAEWEDARSRLDAARGIVDSRLRRQRYAELEQHLLDTAMVIPCWTYSSSGPSAAAALIQSYVHGLQIPTFPRSVLKDVWLDDTAPVRSTAP